MDMVNYELLLKNPQRVPSAIKRRSKYMRLLLSRGELLGAVTFLPYLVAETHFFTDYLKLKADSDGLVKTNTIYEDDIYVRYDDDGIGHELYITGCHEYHSSKLYREELQQMCEKVDEIIVFEIGANVGFYTLSTLSACPNVTVYAVEPIPNNIELLEKNLELNGVRNHVKVTQGAISDSDGETEIHLSQSSNHASINTKGNPNRETIQTKTWRIQSFLEQVDINPKSINVVRLDIEGHESEFLLDDFQAFVDEVSLPFLLHIEIHQKYIEDSTMEEIVEYLDSEFEFISGHQHSVNGELLAAVDDLDEIIEEQLPWTELVLKMT